MGYLEAIADYLQTKGIATLDTNLYIGYLPSSPDTALAIIPTAGYAPESKLAYDKPTIQLFARGVLFTQGYNLLEAVYNVLQSLGSKDISGIHFVDITAIQSKPVTLGRDEQDRSLFSQNYLVQFYNSTDNRE